MTEKRQQDIAKFAGEKQASMKRRSDINNYYSHHIYLLTLAVEGRRQLLGEVVGNPLIPDGHDDAPHIELSALGRAVFECWQQIPLRHPEVRILAFQIMPDHLHGILWVKEEMQQRLGHIIGGFKTGCNKAYRMLTPALPQFTPKKISDSAPIPAAISPAQPSSAETATINVTQAASVETASCSAYVAAVPQRSPSTSPSQPQKRTRCEDRHHGLLFEPNYNDLICKNYEMLPSLINYVKDNPRRLLMKRARPDWLRPFFNLRIGSNTYSGIGNLELLKAPRRLAVRVSRRNNEAQLAEEEQRYLTAAKAGAVLISPAISPGEKRVMRAAFDAKYPTVVIVENGLTPLSKPHGEQFYACAEGRLLMLSPWPHHNERLKLTAQQCIAMNLMALELAGQAGKR